MSHDDHDEADVASFAEAVVEDAECREVATIGSSPPAGGRSAPPQATFVMQLIACHAQLDAYRVKRRLDPEEAGLRYRGAPARAAPRLVDADY